MFKGNDRTESQAVGAPYGRAGSADDLIAAGEEAFASGNLQEAEQCFKKALQLAPFNAKIHNNLSVIHWSRGNVDESLFSLTQALEMDPDDQDVILNCAEVFNKLGKKEDSREILQSYLERKPWDTEVKRELERLNNDNSPVCSQPALSPNTPQSPNGADFFIAEGEQQFERGNLERARVCFEIALEHNAESAKAHSNLGVVQWQQGDMNAALEHLYTAMELDSDDPDILYNSAMALVAAGETSTGADILRLYLQRNPQDENAWEEYEAILRMLGKPDWQPEGLSSEAADIYVRMGVELSGTGDLMGACEAFLRAIQINPEHAEAYYQLGRSHQSLGQVSEGIAMMEEALKIDSFHKKSLLALGEMLVSLERADEATALYRDFLGRQEDSDVHGALNSLAAEVSIASAG